MSARLTARVGAVAAMALGAALVPSAQANAAPGAQAAAAACTPRSLVCIPVNLSSVIPGFNTNASGNSPITLSFGGVALNLDATIDLASIEDVPSALRVVNSVDASLDAHVDGVDVEAFGVGAYAVDSFRVSAGAVYDQEIELGQDVYVADNLQLSGQTSADRLAGANVGDVLSADVVDHASAQAGLENSSEVSALEGPGLATVTADTLRLSSAAELDRLAQAASTDKDKSIYLVDSARLSAQAGNDLLAAIASDDSLAYVADSTRLSAQGYVDNIAGGVDHGETKELIDSVALDADARNDLLADIAAGPEASTEVVDNLAAAAEVTPVYDSSAPVKLVPLVAQVQGLMRLVFGR